MIRWHEGVKDLLVDIDTVKQHPDNPNNGDIEEISASIQINGYFDPVVAQRSTGYILSGNHRYAALLNLGATEIPVVWADVDDVSAARMMVVANRLTRLGRDDPGLLLPLLAALRETEQGLAGTGWTDEQLLDLVPDHAWGSHLPSVPEDDNLRACPHCGGIL